MTSFASICRRLRTRARSESGFSIVEMVVAMTLLGVSMLALAQIMFGSMAALTATNQRSVFLELATAEMETVRTTAYGETCVDTSVAGYTPLPNAIAVTGSACSVAHLTTGTEGNTPYQVRRWVTWTNQAGDDNVAEAGATYKRLTVQLTWTENSKTPRTIELRSVRYPGGFGATATPAGAAAQLVATASANRFVVAPSTSTDPANANVITFTGAAATNGVAEPNVTYTWNFGDGTTPVSGTGASLATRVKSFATAGTYQVSLTTTHPDGRTSDALLEVFVVVPVVGNTAPTFTVSASCNANSTATATCDPLAAYAPLSVTLDATNSFDADDDDLFYTWNWDDASPVEGGWSPLRSHKFERARTYNVVVTAYDLRGGVATRTIAIRALPLNCEVTSGSFTNGYSSEFNHIRVKGNNTVHNTGITFTATSNAACTSLTVRLPIEGGQLTFTGFSSTTSGDTVTWTGTKSIPNNAKFHLLASQTVEYIPWQSDTTRPNVSFAGNFLVSKDNL